MGIDWGWGFCALMLFFLVHVGCGWLRPTRDLLVVPGELLGLTNELHHGMARCRKSRSVRHYFFGGPLFFVARGLGLVFFCAPLAIPPLALGVAFLALLGGLIFGVGLAVAPQTILLLALRACAAVAAPVACVTEQQRKAAALTRHWMKFEHGPCRSGPLVLTLAAMMR